MVMIQGESLGQRAGTFAPPDDPVILLDPQDEDDHLLARLRAGDESAFRALVDRHRPWLVRLCTRLLGYDAHAAEDAAQESLLKLHAAARRDARPLRIRPWLTVVARNTCFDEQRRRRPDLPGELPERAVDVDDPFSLDAALAEAWPRLSGRHREVLYLREVLGFSYKEIGSIMGLSMSAVETLVFRARASLRREYERAGGTAFGCGLFGFHLARGLRGRRGPALPDGVSGVASADPGFSGLTSRLANFLSTSLPGCGEQAMAKVLTLAAGVAVATATVLPGIGPFGDAPAGAAAHAASATMAAAPVSEPSGVPAGTSSSASGSSSLKSWLGAAVPAGWSPQRNRTAATGSAGATTSTPTSTPAAPKERWTPLRDAATTYRSTDRPTLRRDDDNPGPLRSLLPARPETADRPERPAHPLRSLLESFPTLLDPLPVTEPAPVPTEPRPDAPAPAPSPEPTPEPDSHPIREGVEETRGTVFPLRDTLRSGDGNVADRDPTLLQRQDG